MQRPLALIELNTCRTLRSTQPVRIRPLQISTPGGLSQRRSAHCAGTRRTTHDAPSAPAAGGVRLIKATAEATPAPLQRAERGNAPGEMKEASPQRAPEPPGRSPGASLITRRVHTLGVAFPCFVNGRCDVQCQGRVDKRRTCSCSDPQQKQGLLQSCNSASNAPNVKLALTCTFLSLFL